MTALAVAVLLFVLAAAAQAALSAIDRRRYPPPGFFLEADGCALHVHQAGAGAPPVVLEAGIAASSAGWARVLPAVARLTRVRAYDRAGIAWSRPSRCPRTPEQFLRELRAVVLDAGPPVILVGHSFGGLLVRLFAARYPEDVHGLVLVDPPLVSEWADPDPRRREMLRRGIALSRRGALLARFGIVRLGIALAASGAKVWSKRIARFSSGAGGSATVQRLASEVSKLPPATLPLVRAHWSRPSSFAAMAAHLESLPAVASAAARAGIASIPTIVISGGHLSPAQLDEHRRMANVRHLVAEGSGHWVHLDRPDLIVEAVRELLAHPHR